jgi:hypothetical protein
MAVRDKRRNAGGAMQPRTRIRIDGAVAFIIACAGATQFAQADPSPEVRALMNEPVSMFDWGLMELQRMTHDSVKSSASELGFLADQLSVDVSYDFGRNEILIGVYPDFVPRSQAKVDCRNLVNHVRGVACA